VGITKAPHIQNSLLTLTEWHQSQGGTKSLSDYLNEELAQRTPEEGWHYLSSIPRVGPKTAACVLMFNLGQAIMPVDISIYRSTVWQNTSKS
jgi:endonuclease III